MANTTTLCSACGTPIKGSPALVHDTSCAGFTGRPCDCTFRQLHRHCLDRS